MRFALIIFASVIFVRVIAFGQQDLETARQQTIQGNVSDESNTITLRLSPLDASPSAPISYEVPVSGGAFSKQIKLFPGKNDIEVLSASGSQTIQVSVNVKAPRLRVELRWAGGKQDYDLYVNNVYYGNTESDGGRLDRDVTYSDPDKQPPDPTPGVENITFEAAPGGLYRVYVNYYTDNDLDDEGEPKGSPQSTTVRVFVDEQEVHSATKTISEYEHLGGISGNGDSVWNICTLVLHSGQTSGGFTLDSAGFRDILPQKTVLSTSISPRTDFVISSLTGPNGTNEVILPIGGSAHFDATGTVNSGSQNEQTDRKIIEQFFVSDSATADIDSLGVVTGLDPGQTEVDAFGYSGNAIPLFVVAVTYEESYPNSGFDRLTRPNWLMVPVSGTNNVKATTNPAAALSKINFSMQPNASAATVTPTTPASATQTLTLTGVTVADTSRVEARPNNGGTASLGALNVAVKRRQDKTVVIHAITESNDDIQTLPVGQGLPNQRCISWGANGSLDSGNVGGDDYVGAGGIFNGPDGVCQSTKAGDDVQEIPNGKGAPNSAGVGKGTNNARDTKQPAGDDQIDGEDINTGPDGICNTTAYATNLVPTNTPAAAALQLYLNQVFGVQTNTFFTVTRSDFTINYDLNRNDALNMTGIMARGPEEIAIANTAEVANAINVYYVKNFLFGDAVGKALDTIAYVKDAATNKPYVTAHEIGHCMGLKHSDDALTPGFRKPNPGYLFGVDHKLQLMYAAELPNAPILLIKGEWDVVNPN